MPLPERRIRPGALIVVVLLALAVLALIDLMGDESILRALFEGRSGAGSRRGLIRDMLRRWQW